MDNSFIGRWIVLMCCVVITILSFAGVIKNVNEMLEEKNKKTELYKTAPCTMFASYKFEDVPWRCIAEIPEK